MRPGEMAVGLRDALAAMKTPGSKAFRDAASLVLFIADELAERGREETIRRADALHQKAETALQEAQRLVHGDRNADYGHPADNDARIAAMLRALFGWDVKTTDVWMLMVALKLSRERNRPKRDNRVDIAGYAEVGDWIHRDGRADNRPVTIALEVTRGTDDAKVPYFGKTKTT